MLGGAGGNSPSGGKGGAGGSVNNSQVINEALPVIDATTGLPDDTAADFPNSPTNVVALIQGGAGGSVAIHGNGGAGGTVNGLTLKGYNFQVDSGAGGGGVSAGGAGGAIDNVTVEGSSGALPGDNFHAESVVVMTGAGGNGTAGKGGAGGSVHALVVNNADFGAVNATQAADFGATAGFQIATGAGGQAGRGAGGAGGSASDISVTDQDFLTLSHPLGNTGSVSIVTGNGGGAPVAGGKGGAGGALSDVTVVGTRLSVNAVTTGSGGVGGANGLAGKGGAGGSIGSVAIRTAEGLYPSTVTDTAGELFDPNGNFSNVSTGDTVENEVTFATTTVTAVNSTTDLSLADNIIAAGDPYLVDGNTGAAADPHDSQDTLTDTTANFIAEGVKPGDVVLDLNDTANNNNVPVTAVVTSVISSTQLGLSADITHFGDQYEISTLGVAHFTAGAGGAGFSTARAARAARSTIRARSRSGRSASPAARAAAAARPASPARAGL